VGEHQLRPDGGIADGLEAAALETVRCMRVEVVELEIGARVPVAEWDVDVPVLHEEPADEIVLVAEALGSTVVGAEQESHVLDSAGRENEDLRRDPRALTLSIRELDGADTVA